MHKNDKVNPYTKSSRQVKNSHSYTRHRHKGTKSVSNDCRTPQNTPKPLFMRLNETRPDCPHVRCRANDKQYHNNHAIEVEKCALSHNLYVPFWLRFYCFGPKLSV